jgi:hypothetical protein
MVREVEVRLWPEDSQPVLRVTSGEVCHPCSVGSAAGRWVGGYLI